jgi:hypothetical protein
VTIPVKKSQEARYNLDPGSFFAKRFGGKRPDGVAINETMQIAYTFRGLAVESAFYTNLKLKKLDVKDKLFADHVTQVCKAHNRAIVSFLQ